jgi:hypothetical protein
MPRHIHYNEIIAWADGAEIQREQFDGVWLDDARPGWSPHERFRVKPRTIKRSGWINLNGHQDAFASKEAAEAMKFSGAIATVYVEWEETVNE